MSGFTPNFFFSNKHFTVCFHCWNAYMSSLSSHWKKEMTTRYTRKLSAVELHGYRFHLVTCELIWLLFTDCDYGLSFGAFLAHPYLLYIGIYIYIVVCMLIIIKPLFLSKKVKSNNTIQYCFLYLYICNKSNTKTIPVFATSKL